MKKTIAFIILVLPLVAKAKLECQGYNQLGQAISTKAKVDFLPSRTPVFDDEYGVLVGNGYGKTTIWVNNQMTEKAISIYVWSDPRTRCRAGSTISTKIAGFSIDLYSFDPCNHTPVDSIQSEYKGTLTTNQPGQTESMYLTCNSI